MTTPTCHTQHWSCIEFLSDLHLHDGPEGAATAQAFAHYLQHTPANAVFLLGDIFEVWIGDDAATPGSFEALVAEQLHALSQRAAIFFMPGNRDFLLGSAYLAQCGMQPLSDPTCLDLGPISETSGLPPGQAPHLRWLLTHGDAWCLADEAYQRFRQQVRTPAWQAQLLAKPLAERQAIARAMRQASQARQAEMASHADVDTPTALAALHACGAQVLLHGHTHRPAVHTLAAAPANANDPAPALTRIVLSDWDLSAPTPRADLIRLTRQPSGQACHGPPWAWQRIALGSPGAAALFGPAAAA